MNLHRFLALFCIGLVKIASFFYLPLRGWADGMLIGLLIINMLECIDKNDKRRK